MPHYANHTIILAMTQIMVGVDVRIRARFYRGMADPARIAILDSLRGGERTVGTVATETGLSVSNASRHLACLKDCGLVEARQEWRYVHYRLADGVGDMLAANSAFIERVSERVAACERPEMGEAR